MEAPAELASALVELHILIELAWHELFALLDDTGLVAFAEVSIEGGVEGCVEGEGGLEGVLREERRRQAKNEGERFHGAEKNEIAEATMRRK